MPTILRSSAVGKLSDGSTTTVPSPRSSGSLAGYRTAKGRCSSSNGNIGGGNDIAKDKQSLGTRTPPPFRRLLFSGERGAGHPGAPRGPAVRGAGGRPPFYRPPAGGARLPAPW